MTFIPIQETVKRRHTPGYNYAFLELSFFFVNANDYFYRGVILSAEITDSTVTKTMLMLPTPGTICDKTVVGYFKMQVRSLFPFAIKNVKLKNIQSYNYRPT
jgi:hypothetical protein